MNTKLESSYTDQREVAQKVDALLEARKRIARLDSLRIAWQIETERNHGTYEKMTACRSCRKTVNVRAYQRVFHKVYLCISAQ